MSLRIAFVASLPVVLLSLIVGCGGSGSGGSNNDSAPDGESYDEMAARFVAAQIEAVINDLAGVDPAIEHTSLRSLDADTLPHQVKSLRKALGKARDFVDVFSYAYPSDVAGEDPWLRGRDELDDGYELLGAFKDLFDSLGGLSPAVAALEDNPCEAMAGVCEEASGACSTGITVDVTCGAGNEEQQCCLDYDPVEIAGMRGEILTWVDEILAREPEILDYFRDPASRRLFDRRSRDMSPFYWAGIDEEPTRDLNGVDNLARLEREIARVVGEELEVVTDINNIVNDPDDEERFHDFRKRARGIEKLAAYFPEIFDPSDELTAALLVVEITVDELGAMNDSLVRFHRLTDPDEEDELADEIDDVWDAFRADTTLFAAALETIRGATVR